MAPPRAVDIRWHKLRALSKEIYAHGTPQMLVFGGNLAAVGTLAAQVLVFENHRLVHLLELPSRKGGYGAVTALQVHKRHIVVGYKSGFVALWTDFKLAMLSPPIQRPPRPNSTHNDRQGHLRVPITSVVMWGQTIVSSDASGIVIQHHLVRLLTENTIHTKRLLGEYNSKTPTSVLSMLRFDSLLCVLTPLHLVLYSLQDGGVVFVLKNHLEGVLVSGDLSCDPERSLLAVCWGTSLQILRLSWTPVRRQRPQVICTAEKAWQSPQPLVKAAFVGSIVLLVDAAATLTVLNLETLVVMHQESLLDKHIVHLDLFSSSLEVVADSFSSSLVFDNSPMLILGQYEIYYGSFTHWADQIMASLNCSSPISALKLALHYFTTDANLELVGLGPDREMVAESMPDIIITLLRYTLEMEPINTATVLDICLDAIVTTGIPLIEQVYDLVEPHQDEILLLHKILKLVVDGQIRLLEPRVYRRLVAFLGEKKLGADLERVLLLLDPSTLDLDLAFQVCSELKLDSVLFYLSFTVLKEYVKPLESTSNLRYDYLRDSLAGIVFPTGDKSSLVTQNAATHDIYMALFHSDSHDLLVRLLEAEPDRLFGALESAFEQPYLNEDNADHLNRQYIISVLRMVCKDKFRIFYSVFVAKSISKYPQFVVLRGSELEKVLQELTSAISKHDTGYTSRENLELAAQSLLSVYSSHNFDNTIALLNEAGFNSALEQLYSQRKDWKNLLRILLVHLEASGPFSGFWQQLSTCLRDPSVAGSVIDAAPLLARTDAKEFSKLVLEYSLDMFDSLDRIDEEPRLAVLEELAAHRLPPQQIIISHINLLAKFDGAKLMHTLRTVYGPKDIQLPMVVDSLVNYDRTDALVLLMSRIDRDSEAMIYLLNHIENNRENQAEVDWYVALGVDLCTKVAARDYHQGEKIWQKLLSSLSSMEIDTMLVVQQLVQFTLGDSVESDNSKAHPKAHLGTNVVSNLYKEEGINLFEQLNSVIEQQKLLVQVVHQIFHGMSYQDILQVLQQRLTGWTLSIDGECEKCGEKVCGLGVDAEKLYNEWEVRSKNIALPESSALVAFRCTHVYHSRCLVPTPEGNYQCILCGD